MCYHTWLNTWLGNPSLETGIFKTQGKPDQAQSCRTHTQSVRRACITYNVRTAMHDVSTTCFQQSSQFIPDQPGGLPPQPGAPGAPSRHAPTSSPGLLSAQRRASS